MAAKLEWGAKRTCPACGARFYDMRRDPITCPKCGTAFDPEAVFRPRRARSTEPAAKAPAKPKPAAAPVEKKAAPEEEEELLEAEDLETDDTADDEDDEDLIEDTSDLGEDDSDLPPVGRDDEEEP